MIFFGWVWHLENPTRRNLTLEKHFMNFIFYKDDKLYIKFFQKIFFYAINTIIKLFFTIVYIIIITLTLIFHDHPLVEYPLWYENSLTFIFIIYQDVEKSDNKESQVSKKK